LVAISSIGASPGSVNGARWRVLRYGHRKGDQSDHQSAANDKERHELEEWREVGHSRTPRAFNDAQGVTVSGHKFKIGQLVNHLGRVRASGDYQVTQLLPPEGEVFQYRIKNPNEPQERVAKEHELRSAA
jgi:hypothetical protein